MNSIHDFSPVDQPPTSGIDILTAATSHNALQAALAYQQLGISVLPCEGKRPALKHWGFLTHRRAERETIYKWSVCELLRNVGIILGEVSHNLVVIDLDGEKAVEAFRINFPQLMDTYTVVSGSGVGLHVYLYSRRCPPTTRVTGCAYGNVELRSNGTYVIAPPSIHPNGKPYRVGNRHDVQIVDDLRDVMEWIKLLIAQKHGGRLPPANNAVGKIFNASPYARAALASECERVRYASPGTRNDTLNAAAFRLARFVRDRQISRSEVESALTDAAAALAEQDGLSSVTRTIKSGLDAGIIKYGTKK